MNKIDKNSISTNAAGRKFLNTYFDRYEIINMEISSRSRKEYAIIYTYIYKGVQRYSVAIIPMIDGDTNPCFYGSLEHYAKIKAAERSGITLIGNAHPKWYTDLESEQYKKFVEIYNNIINSNK